MTMCTHGSILVLSTLLLGLVQPALAIEDKPAIAPYNATYSATAMGMQLQGKRSLQKTAANEYTLSSSTSLLFNSIDNTSVFTLSKSGQLRTQDYSEIRTGFGSDKSIKQTWDWAKGTITSNYKNKDYQYALTDTALDRINYQLQLRLDAIKYGSNFGQRTYSIANRKSLKHNFTVDYIGEEKLSLKSGTFNTAKFKRTKDSKNSDTIWLAKDWGYLIVKISHCEKDQCNDLLLTEATIDGKKVTSL